MSRIPNLAVDGHGEMYSAMDDTTRKLIFEFALGRLSIDEFVLRFGVDPRIDPDYVRRALECAIDHRSAPDVESAMALAFSFGFSASWAQIFCNLLGDDWHTSHEDIASALQDIRDPSTVDCLFQRACNRPVYLEYDDNFALAVKCIWALHDIGTADAEEKLRLLADSDIPSIRNSALERLNDLSARHPGDPEPAYRRVRDQNVRRD
jgi:hypothetical protein